MTAVVCWERRVPPLSELIFASDSRTKGGETWDACPKLFNIGRADIVMAFAGNTFRAYPFVLQALATVASYKGSERKSLDVAALAGQLKRTMNVMLAAVTDEAIKGEPPDCEFLVGGWSWRLSKFRAYKIFYEPVSSNFISSAAKQAPSSLGGNAASSLYATIGDGGSAVTRALARTRRQAPKPLDLEPIDALSAVIEDAQNYTVGGPLQVMKAYRSLTSECFAVTEKGITTISGRRMIKEENHDLRVLTKTNGRWSLKE